MAISVYRYNKFLALRSERAWVSQFDLTLVSYTDCRPNSKQQNTFESSTNANTNGNEEMKDCTVVPNIGHHARTIEQSAIDQEFADEVKELVLRISEIKVSLSVAVRIFKHSFWSCEHESVSFREFQQWSMRAFGS